MEQSPDNWVQLTFFLLLFLRTLSIVCTWGEDLHTITYRRVCAPLFSSSSLFNTTTVLLAVVIAWDTHTPPLFISSARCWPSCLYSPLRRLELEFEVLLLSTVCVCVQASWKKKVPPLIADFRSCFHSPPRWASTVRHLCFLYRLASSLQSRPCTVKKFSLFFSFLSGREANHLMLLRR
jgi:hypothetical protein